MTEAYPGGSAPPAPPAQLGSDAIALSYEVSAADMRAATVAASRRWVGGNVLAGVFVGTGIAGMLVGDLSIGAFLIFGLLLWSGVIALVGSAIRERRQPLTGLPKVLEASSLGLRWTSPGLLREAAWPQCRGIVRSSSTLFVELVSRDTIVIPMRVLDRSHLDRLVALATNAGVPVAHSSLRAWLTASLPGCLLGAIGYALLFRLAEAAT